MCRKTAVAVDWLEWRVLFQGVVSEVNVQFAPSKVTPADGYVIDAGETFSARDDSGDLNYGWLKKGSPKPLARKDSPESADARYDSFANMKSGAVWELAVPNGLYSVHLVAGDSKAKKGVFGFDVEGASALRGQTTAAQRWIESTTIVSVSDGLLTIASAAGFKKNKLNFIDIAPAPPGSVAAPQPGGSHPAPLTPDAEGFFPLFNGSDLNGFYTYIDDQGANRDPQSFFKVTDGMLHIMDVPATADEQPFGYLSTLNAYADYHLQFQYQWGEKKFAPRATDETPRDSGVLIHVNSQDLIWPASVEAQIQENDTGDVWLLGPLATSADTTVASRTSSPLQYSEGGTRVNVSNDRIVKSETNESLTDWNTVEVIADGATVVVIVNGTVVNRVTNVKNGDGSPLNVGKIAFQAEGAEIFYRDIGIKPLNAYGALAQPTSEDAVVLFDGTTTSRFVQRDDGSSNPWDLANGALVVDPGEGDIESIDKFTDYALHLEFQVPVTATNLGEQDRGNSGVGLSGSYELQILDSFGRELSDTNDIGAIYGLHDPLVNAALPAGVWQTYDVTFTAPRYEEGKKIFNARITARLNGKLIQDDVEIEDATFTFESEQEGPRPIILQDHGNLVKFRNIWVDPA
jgi:hypothetical protein